MKQLYYACLLVFACSLNQVAAQLRPLDNCGRVMPYIQMLGFQPGKIAWSTSDRTTVGLLCFEVPARPELPVEKQHQHTSWSSAGHLGAIAVDEKGNVYVGPAPRISTFYNPPEKQNTIFKVDAQTGVMEPLLALPALREINAQNPFGILGLTYDCDHHILYASSVAGASPEAASGRIFAIEHPATTPEIVAVLENVNAFGLTVCYLNGVKKLMFGSSDDSGVYAINLDKNGGFEGQAELQLSIADLGARGDDKVRKMKVSNSGYLMIWGVPFYYNLAALEDAQNIRYAYVYIPDIGWKLEQIID